MMLYEPATEKASIIAQRKSNDIYKMQYEINKIRRQILFCLSIELAVMIIYFILEFSNIVQCILIKRFDLGIFIESLITMISICYLLVFLTFVMYYFPVAMSFFTWLSLVPLLEGFLVLILSIMGVVLSLSSIDEVKGGIMIDIVYSFIGIVIIILSVLIILNALNLRKLIK